jgi:hypothetical protein
VLKIDSNINPNIGLHTSQQYVGQFQAPWRLRMGSPPLLRPLRNLLANFKPELRAANLNPFGLGASHASSCAFADLLRLQFRQ